MSFVERLKHKFGLATPHTGRHPIRIFLLEDDERRCAWFENRFKGDMLHISKEVAEAKQLLEANTYDSIFLDHDLKPEHYHAEEFDDEHTGYAIASFLASRPELQRAATIRCAKRSMRRVCLRSMKSVASKSFTSQAKWT